MPKIFTPAAPEAIQYVWYLSTGTYGVIRLVVGEIRHGHAVSWAVWREAWVNELPGWRQYDMFKGSSADVWKKALQYFEKGAMG